MVINSTPINFPISTANIPTETVRNETRLQERVPETKPSTENVKLKPGTEDSNTNNRSENRVAQDNQGNRTVEGRSENSQGDGSQGEGSQGDGQERDSRQERQEQRQEREIQQQVEQLKSRDREVRAHEAAHAAVGGQYAGAPTYTFQTGPDGRRYAVGGEVSIDVGAISGDPEATIRKMQQVRNAALAPQDPSSQDQRVAAQATAQEAAARAELGQQRREEAQAARETNSDSPKQRFEVRLQRLGAVESNETGERVSVTA